MNKLSYENFSRCLDAIVKQVKKDMALADMLECEGTINFTDNIINEFIYLLEKLMDDKNAWIQYWMWELDFGEKYKEGMVAIDDQFVPLKTIRDLYNVLVEDSNE